MEHQEESPYTNNVANPQTNNQSETNNYPPMPVSENYHSSQPYSPPPSQQFQNNNIVGNPPLHSTAVDIVWQWVSYGLWEWALISLSILLTVTFSYYLNTTDNSNYSWVVYVLATMLCLLPMAFIANKIFSKREIPQKHGFSAVVMVLNAVVVFLATIGGLIGLVISVLQIFVSSTPSPNTKIYIISSLIVVVLSAMLFIRIINPAKLSKFIRLFPYIVIAVAGIALILTIAGPFRSEISNRQDRLIEDNLPSLNNSIQDYVSTKGSLPESLSSLDLSNQSGPKALVSQNLVSYQNLGPTNVNKYSYSTTYAQPTQSSYSYKLCATYKKAKKSSTYQGAVVDSVNSTYIDTSNHGAGQQCYTQTATKY